MQRSRWSGLVGEPAVRQHLVDGPALVHVPIEHPLDQVERAAVGQHEWHAQFLFDYLVRVVKRVLFIDQCIEQDAHYIWMVSAPGSEIIIYATYAPTCLAVARCTCCPAPLPGYNSRWCRRISRRACRVSSRRRCQSQSAECASSGQSQCSRP